MRSGRIVPSHELRSYVGAEATHQRHIDNCQFRFVLLSYCGGILRASGDSTDIEPLLKEKNQQPLNRLR